MNLGPFLNEFAANPTIFWSMLTGALFLLGIFGYFFNKLMDQLKNGEHTSHYVVIGVAVTLLVAALFSWKAALLLFVLFVMDGIFMVVGEHRRTLAEKEAEEEQKKTPRRKRLPYAANGRIDDARMSVVEACRLVGMTLKEKDPTARAMQLATISHELNNADRKLLELKLIQQIEE